MFHTRFPYAVTVMPGVPSHSVKRLNLGFLRRWQRVYTTSLILMVALALASAINGWKAFMPAQMVLVNQTYLQEELPRQAPLKGPILVLSPHPDDETLGVAGVIQDALKRGEEVWVVFMTSGDAFPWTPAYLKRSFDGGAAMREYAQGRMVEAREATAKLGVPADHVLFLGFPDRGLTRLETQNLTVPFTSKSTRVNRVPYQGALEPGAAYTGRQLMRQLRLVAGMAHPKVILTPSVLDNHPDHRATAHAALRLADDLNASVYYFPVHNGLEWPLPKGHHPDLPLSPPRAQEQDGMWHSFPLTPAEQQGKADAVREYRSQTLILGRFMWAFVRRNELLRPAEVPDTTPGGTP